jgi:N-acetylglucosaminyldiphosphoundecaprenol N-acetyl-beta-D-mannosaminyltransferase
MKSNRLKILGVSVDAYDSVEELLQDIEEGMKGAGTKSIFSINPEKIMRTRKDPALTVALENSDFLIPDGIGVVLAIKILHKKRVSRITGVDLMGLLLDKAEKRRYRVYIFGAKPAVLPRAIIEIKNRYPSLDIVGSTHGYVQEDLYASLVNDINSVNSDILFVGLGSPKQENWIHGYKNVLNVKLCMGIGGSLDVIAGNIPRAPYFFRTLSLEWFYRLIKEPNRIRRQLVLPHFFFELLKEKSF